MTPKEKAIEIRDKFKSNTRIKWKDNALICVDQIINLLSIEPPRASNKYQSNKYWISVKNEIKKL